MDDLFPDAMLNALLPEIDGMQQNQWKNVDQDPRERTLRMKSAVEIGAAGERFLNVVHSAAFLHLLSEITGIQNLLPDPYLLGGGYAAMRRGDYFNVHSDRSVAYDTGLTRRLAMIVFLNKEWLPQYHGQLELWNPDAKTCEVFIEPSFNKTALFEVAFPNYHGVPIPLECPVDRSRQSFILYYHTVGIDGKRDVTPHTSLFAPRTHGTNRLTMRSVLRDITPPVLTRALAQIYQDRLAAILDRIGAVASDRPVPSQHRVSRSDVFMSLQRILRMLASFFTGQGVSIVSQLLIPPFFLLRYADGVEVYGEWVALSAAVTYLSTLNYGIQTYANNQMTIEYNRGEIDAAKALQAGALRLLLLVIGIVAVAAACVFVMPIDRWLNLHHASSFAAAATLYLLVLQVLLNMLFALFANSYMMVGRMHRGANWMIFQRLAATLGLAVCAWFRASFPLLAAVQLASVVIFTVLVIVDVRRTAPILVPSLRYGRWRDVRPMLTPSAHFGLLSLSSFLTYQGPVLLIQTLLGPAAVTTFSLARTVFSMGRQALAILSFSIGQEITLLIGQRNWPALKRLYDLSERVVLLLVPIFSVGVLLVSPFLFAVWLHRRNLYDPGLCFIMAVISAVMGIKEHKYQFQSSSNEHERLSRFTLASYAAMLLVAAFLMKPFGIFGFMAAWLAAELAQTFFILRLNVQLFPADMSISMAPVMRLVAVLVIAFGLAAWPVFAAVQWSLTAVVGSATLIMLLISAGSYFAFGLDEVRLLLTSKLRERLVRRPQS